MPAGDARLDRWNRRHVLGAGLAGAGWLTLGGLPSWAREDDLAGKTLNLVLRYRTDPERISRVLPPGLEPDEVAEVTVDWWLLYPRRGGENLFFPAPYTESGIHVTARYQGHRGMFQVGMPLDQDWGRVAGRENVGLLKKDGVLRLERRGRIVRADLRRRGRLLYRIETEVTDRPAHPLFWHRETGWGAFLYRYRLHPDWRRGPLGDDPVELWLRVLGGKRGAYPEARVEGAPRECDAARTRFEMVEASPLDPFAEFPLREIVGVSYRETGLYPDADAKHREAPTESRIERLQLVDPARFEPWAFHAYDRPITASVAWSPPGWPEKATALKLTADEIDRYRRRESLKLELRAALDLRLRLAPALHARTLPPTIEAGPEPLVRILALEVGTSDVSTEPFRELWLLARCLRDGRESWYALSHLVGAGGDVVTGRETFGYPSRMAEVDWRSGATAGAGANGAGVVAAGAGVVTPGAGAIAVGAGAVAPGAVAVATGSGATGAEATARAPGPSSRAAGPGGEEHDRLAITASRLGRVVVRILATGVAAGERGGEPRSTEPFDILGLRLHPPYRVMTEHGFREPGPRLDLVAQPWSLELAGAAEIDLDAVTLELPDQPGPGRIGRPDPWYELASGELTGAVFGCGVLRRLPGRDLGPLGSLEEVEHLYLERCDGTLAAAEATSGEVAHTFLVR